MLRNISRSFKAPCGKLSKLNCSRKKKGYKFPVDADEKFENSDRSRDIILTLYEISCAQSMK